MIIVIKPSGLGSAAFGGARKGWALPDTPQVPVRGTVAFL